jgi:hypothetical protein
MDVPTNSVSIDIPTSSYPETSSQANEGPSMYEQYSVPSSTQRYKPSKSTSHGVKLPTVWEYISSNGDENDDDCFVPPMSSSRSTNAFNDKNPYPLPYVVSTPPSGAYSHSLYPVEEHQRTVLDDMIRKRSASGHDTASSHTTGNRPWSTWSSLASQDVWNSWREPVLDGSASKKQRSTNQESPRLFGFNASRRLWNSADESNTNANQSYGVSSFSIPVDNGTFHRNGSTSSDNINIKFSPGDWTGKFEGAGAASYFQPEQKAANMTNKPRSRAQSASSRSRGRSPIKIRPIDPHSMQQPPDSEATAESPGGTKFSKEEWAKTFKNPTFVAPPPPSSTIPPRTTRPKSRPIRKPTAGSATFVDESDSSTENTKFPNGGNGGNATAPPQPSPDAMDVDIPPVMKPTIPKVVSLFLISYILQS